MDIKQFIDRFYGGGKDEGGGYEAFKKLTPEEQDEVYRAAKEGLGNYSRKEAYGPKWEELYQSAGKTPPALQKVRIPSLPFLTPPASLEVGAVRRGWTFSPENRIESLPNMSMIQGSAPTWEREYPAEGAPAEEMKQYQKDFKKHQAALPRIYGSDDPESPEFAPEKASELHSAARKVWNRDFDEAARRESATSDKKHQAWRDKVAGETKKRYQVEDEEFKNKVAAQEKWYEEARARIAANNEKLKRMGLL